MNRTRLKKLKRKRPSRGEPDKSPLKHEIVKRALCNQRASRQVLLVFAYDTIVPLIILELALQRAK